MRKEKPQRWSRKGRCPGCDVGTSSAHRKDCNFDYSVKLSKNQYLLSINRSGEFLVNDVQRTTKQCGREGMLHYKYFCSITASNRSLTPEGYVMENLWTDRYFQEMYADERNMPSRRTPIPSCEKMAMDAVDYFRHLFKTHDDLKAVDLRSIYIRIHGSPVSFIECEWKKDQ